MHILGEHSWFGKCRWCRAEAYASESELLVEDTLNKYAWEYCPLCGKREMLFYPRNVFENPQEGPK